MVVFNYFKIYMLISDIYLDGESSSNEEKGEENKNA